MKKLLTILSLTGLTVIGASIKELLNDLKYEITKTANDDEETHVTGAKSGLDITFVKHKDEDHAKPKILNEANALTKNLKKGYDFPFNSAEVISAVALNQFAIPRDGDLSKIANQRYEKKEDFNWSWQNSKIKLNLEAKEQKIHYYWGWRSFDCITSGVEMTDKNGAKRNFVFKMGYVHDKQYYLGLATYEINEFLGGASTYDRNPCLIKTNIKFDREWFDEEIITKRIAKNDSNYAEFLKKYYIDFKVNNWDPNKPEVQKVDFSVSVKDDEKSDGYDSDGVFVNKMQVDPN